MTQRIERIDIGPVLGVRFTDDEHQPSWVAYGNGFAEIVAKKHERAGWLALAVTEHRSPDRMKANDKGASKQVMVTLGERAARAFYDALREMFEPVTAGRTEEGGQ